ncbi:hypothetical protein OC835_005397 [Tilletia horrida]|nr:hypothetical protein OC835_005397 [Tilletia horrida]
MTAAASAPSWVQPRTLTLPQPSLLGAQPGFTHEQAKAAHAVLNDNHDQFNVFFNLSGFHNHLAHHVLAALALSAPPSHYQRADTHARSVWLDPAFKLNHKPVQGDGIERITRGNWTAHLLELSYYWSYLAFFEDEIAQHGVPATLEHFLFDEQHALASPAHMLLRLFGGALHPLIHIGYGLEFGIDGIVAEGLAMAAITEARETDLFPEGWYAKAHCHTPSEQKKGTKVTPSTPRSGLSLFTIFAQMGADPALAPGTAAQWSDASKFASVLKSCGTRIARYLEHWHTTPEDVQGPEESAWGAKVDELIWINTLLLGATSRPHYPTPTPSGSAKGEPPLQHNFFLMHTHNATLFLPSYLRSAALSPRARALLLHGLARSTAYYWIATGRPDFFVAERLYDPRSLERAYRPEHQGSDANSTERAAALMDRAEEKGVIDSRSSPWYDLLPAASLHMDEHLVKAIRAQAYFASRLGHTAPGSLHLQEEDVLDGGGSKGEGKEERVWKGQLGLVDGSAFVRTAGQMMESQTWAASGLEADMKWTQQAIGFDEAWVPKGDEHKHK